MLFNFLIIIALLSAKESFATAKWAFVGDIMLGREVEKELQAKPGTSPWKNAAFSKDEIVFGNFEGAVGDQKKCTKGRELCLSVQPNRISLLKEAGFSFVSLENNHSQDLGAESQLVTDDLLQKSGVKGITFKDSPYFVRRNGVGVAVIALNLVSEPRPTRREIARKVQFAKRLADWTVVQVHWGTELISWPNDFQKAIAQFLTSGGVDLIIGHHPHVVQEPECINNRPVYYSLGNHLFDQRYASTHSGLSVHCEFDRNSFNCKRIESRRSDSSSFPIWTEKKFKPLSCEANVARAPSDRRQYWTAVSENGGRSLILVNTPVDLFRSKAFELVNFAEFSLPKNEQAVFISHQAYSDFDRKISLRPAVYAWKDGRFSPLWKGSALAYPAEEMEVFEDKNGSFLCALHSKTTHFLEKETPRSFRTMAYQWNGFGFSREIKANREKECSDWGSKVY